MEGRRGGGGRSPPTPHLPTKKCTSLLTPAQTLPGPDLLPPNQLCLSVNPHPSGCSSYPHRYEQERATVYKAAGLPAPAPYQRQADKKKEEKKRLFGDMMEADKSDEAAAPAGEGKAQCN